MLHQAKNLVSDVQCRVMSKRLGSAAFNTHVSHYSQIPGILSPQNLHLPSTTLFSNTAK